VPETAAKVPELAQAYLKGLDGAVRKVFKAAVYQRDPAASEKHGPSSGQRALSIRVCFAILPHLLGGLWVRQNAITLLDN
jgi:hypothetical protein